MKNIKRIYAVVLTAALILTLLPAMVFAEGEDATEQWDAYFFGAPYGIAGSSEIKGLYEYGTSVDLYYNESDSVPGKIYEYGDYKYKDSNGVEQEISGFLEKGADPSSFENYATVNVDYDEFDTLKEGANEVPVIICVPTGIDEEGHLKFKEFYKKLRIWVSIERPLKVVFIPADGFKVKGNVGYNYIDEEDFYGEGNKFVVTIETRDDPEYVTPDIGSIEAEYLYYKSDDGSVEGFFDNGNPEYERFDMSEGFECYLERGLNRDVELTYYAYVEGLEEPVKLNFNIDIDVDKYSLYSEEKTYVYTGKVIKPEVVIYNTDDDVVPAEEYTYTVPGNKKIGRYDIDVTIRDEFRDKYDTDTVKVSYNIVPKAPVLSSLIAGKKKLTVKWKKLSSKDLKNIDGMYIELSTEKDFSDNCKSVKLSKKAVKSGKKVVKGLVKGKPYYVRMYAFKNVSGDPIESGYSKIKSKKTK